MSAAAEHTHYPSAPPQFLGIDVATLFHTQGARVTNMAIVASLSQSYVLILDFFAHYLVLSDSSGIQCNYLSMLMTPDVTTYRVPMITTYMTVTITSCTTVILGI